MAITINWTTRTIDVPLSFMTFVSGQTYRLDADVFRLALKDLEDDPEGMAFPRTHSHNAEVLLSGVTYARVVEVINNYRIMFENTGTPYIIEIVGANHNIGDVTEFDGSYSMVLNNAAGLIVTQVNVMMAAPTAAEVWQNPVEGATTAEEALRIILAALANKATGGGTGTIAFRDIADTKDRLVLTVDAEGNRSVATQDGA
jgi:hypothetical protein